MYQSGPAISVAMDNIVRRAIAEEADAAERDVVEAAVNNRLEDTERDAVAVRLRIMVELVRDFVSEGS